MIKFYTLLFVACFAKFSITKPSNFEYELYSDEFDNSSLSQELDDNSASLEISEIVKRDVLSEIKANSSDTLLPSITTERTFNLSDLITHIENAFVKSANSVVEAFSKLNENQTDLFDHRIQKKEIFKKNEESFNRSTETSTSDEDESITKIPLHSSTGYFSIIPIFDHNFFKRNVKRGIEKNGNKSSDNSSITSEIENNKTESDITIDFSTTEVVESLNATTTIEKLLIPMEKLSNTNDSVSSTTKDPIKVLKDNEEEVKEKVAEIEAEPIILSSRV